MGLPAWFAPSILACTGVVLLRPQAAQAIGDFTGYTPVTNDLYSTWGDRGAPVVRNTSPSFVGAGLDFSGIGYGELSELFQRAYLTPIHVASAAHTQTIQNDFYVAPATGGAVLKMSGGNTTVLGVGIDSSIGVMTGAHIGPADGVTTYAVLDLASASSYNGMTVFEVGHGNSDPGTSPRVAVTTITSIPSTVFTTSRPPAPLQGGDSGGPTMATWTNPLGGKELTFLGTHYGTDFQGNTVNSSNFFAHTSAINAANTKLRKDKDGNDIPESAMIHQGFAVRLVGVAATRWTGNASSSFVTGGNWTSGTPTSTNYVAFNGNSALQRAVDFGGGARDMRGIQFGPGAAEQGFIFNNGTLQIGRGGIANYSSAVQAFDSTLDVTLTDHQYWDAINADLHVSGPVNLNGKLLVVQGNENTRISGVISDSAATSIGLTKYGLGELLLTEAAAYAGKTWIYGGTLRLEGNGLLPANNTLVIANNNTSRLEMGGKQLTFASLTSFPGQPGQFATIDLGAGGRITLDQLNNVDAALSAAITGGTSGATSLVLRGPSGSNIEYTLGGDSSYAGQTRIERGTFFLSHANALGATGVGNETIISTDETNLPVIRITGGGTISESLIFHNAGTTNSGSTSTTVTITAPELTLNGPITLTRAVTVSGRTTGWQFQTSNAPGLVSNVRFGTITGQLDSSAATANSTLTLNLFNGSQFWLDGVISNGTLSTLALTLRGDGTINLSAANSYTGATSVQGRSTVVNVNALSNQNGAFGKATSAISVGGLAYDFVTGLYAGNGVEIGRNLSMSDRNLVGVRVGVLDGATALYSGTMTLNRTETGLYAGAGGQATFSNNIVNGAVSGVAVTGKLIKQGDGVVVLSGNNSYTGGTGVEAGRLRAASANALGTTGAVAVTGGVFEVATGVTLANTNLQLNGGRVEVNGTINALDFQAGTLGGSGSVNASLALDSSSKTLAPGPATPGALTLVGEQTWSGFTYDWQVNDLSASASASAADRINITGALALDGDYVLRILSLTPANQPGGAANYTEGDRLWTILTATGGITGFDTADWTLDPSLFTIATGATGDFDLYQNGNALMLSFTEAVPEPSSIAWTFGAAAFAMCRRRRRN